MGNNSNVSCAAQQNAQYLQKYLDEQVRKKRDRLGQSSRDQNYMNCLCCNGIERSFIKPIKWRQKFNEECCLLRKKTDFDWALILPNILSSYQSNQAEDSYRTDLILLIFSSSKIFFPEMRKIDSIEHYDENCFNSKENQLSFNVPLNSRCNTDHSSQANESIYYCDDSFNIDFFPEKSSPIKMKERVFSFSKKSIRNADLNANDITDSIMEDWKNMDYKNIKELDLKELLYATYASNPSFKLYKVILDRIEKHLNDGKHILGEILTEYIDQLLKTYLFIDQVLFEKISIRDLKSNLACMIKDIHQFTRVFQITLSEFYQFDTIKKKNKDLSEFLDEINIENFIVQLIYQRQEVYDIIYEVEKHLAKVHQNEFSNIKNLLVGLDIKDCFTPYENKAKMKLLTPSMKNFNEDLNTKESRESFFPKGFDNFSIAIDHYDNNIFKPLNKYKDLIEGIKFLKNPLDKLTIFSKPRQIIMKYMEDVDFPDFDLIDERDEIKILFYLIMKTDVITVFIELNLIVHSVRAKEHELKIINTLIKCILKIIKLAKRNELEYCLKEEGFIAKMIEKKYVKKSTNHN